MKDLKSDFTAAFGSISSLLGVSLSAVATFNFLSHTLQIGLSALLQQLLSAFRSIFHPLVDALTAWLPFALTDAWKDGLVIWCVIGGAVARTTLVKQRHPSHPPRRRGDPVSLVRIRRVRPRLDAAMRIATLALAFAIWPIFLPFLFREPIATRVDVKIGDRVRSVVSYGKRIPEPLTLSPEAMASMDEAAKDVLSQLNQGRRYDHDLRRVFALQLAAVLTVIGALVLLNAAGVDR